MTKCYVSVMISVDEVGKKIPKVITVEDKDYEVTRVVEVKNCASLKVGGIGERYTVKINGRETFLYFETETGRWFVELKK